MKIDRNKFAELQRRLRAAKPKYPVWTEDPGTELAPGQVWTPAVHGTPQHRSDEWPPWNLVVVEKLDGGMVNVCPMFLWGELAGPDDLFVPEEWIGVNAVVSFELESTVDRVAFEKCEGRIPEQALAYILRARSDLSDEARRAAHNWGWPYLDAIDRRLIFHENIAETIEALQASVRETVYAGDELGAAELPTPARIIPFLKKVVCDSLPSLEPLPAAADAGEEKSQVLFLSQPSGEQEQPVLRETPAPPRCVAECLRFEPLLPEMSEPPVVEWKISAPVPSGARAFVFHAPRRSPEMFLGEAGLDRGRDGATLVTLSAINTSEIKKAVETPRELLIIILTSNEAAES